MEYIRVFDMLKIGVGPSSSHTLGPWRSAQEFTQHLLEQDFRHRVTKIQVHLFGSLSLTGKGHATDKAIQLGLGGWDPVTIKPDEIEAALYQMHHHKQIMLWGVKSIPFDPKTDLFFERTFLAFHPNGLTFKAYAEGQILTEQTYFSIGGGFITQEKPTQLPDNAAPKNVPFPYKNGEELLAHCQQQGASIAQIALANESVFNTQEEIEEKITAIWQVMRDAAYEGCHSEGILPGGLAVKRRAYTLHQSLIKNTPYTGPEDWITAIRSTEVKFKEILKWVSCIALSINEVNASMGKVVTAPTNGSAGVIPAVLFYYLVIDNHDAHLEEINEFLLVSATIGSIFKQGATISAALGGCQAEIGVSSAMAAAGLTELLGGNQRQVLMAGEIAMEHHLGLTCDPVGGLVQIPCIERNTMGAIKAITAAQLALQSKPDYALVSLDKVIHTMWQTALDMNVKYKETADGGLATQIPIGLAE
jgi:L-serine dehydratase